MAHAGFDIAGTVGDYGADKASSRCGRRCVVWLLWILHMYDLIGDTLLFYQVFSVTCCYDTTEGSFCGDTSIIGSGQRSDLDDAYCQTGAVQDEGYWYYSALDGRCDHDQFAAHVDTAWTAGQCESAPFGFRFTSKYIAIVIIADIAAFCMMIREFMVLLFLLLELCEDGIIGIQYIIGCPLFPIFAFLKAGAMRKFYHDDEKLSGYRMILINLLVEDIPGIVINLMILRWFDTLNLINVIAISGSILMVLRSCWVIRQENN